jgi:hypothetical protein
MGAESYARLTASGVRVVGDPARLVPEAPPAGASASFVEREPLVDAETAATIAMGVAWGFGLKLGADQPEDSRQTPLGFVTTRELAGHVLRREVGRVKRRLKLARVKDG